jgi:hypothetical protein
MPDAYSVPANAQGGTFSFGGTEYRVVSVKFDQKGSEMDVTDMSVAEGSYRIYAASPIKEGAEVSVEFWGTTAPTVLDKQEIAFSKIDAITGQAICTGVSLDAKVGEIIKGTASFRLSSE